MAKSKTKSTKTKKEKKPTQTDFMRNLIKNNAKRETITERLAEEFGKEEAWAKSRIKTYERAYGEMGKDDPKL